MSKHDWRGVTKVGPFLNAAVGKLPLFYTYFRRHSWCLEISCTYSIEYTKAVIQLKKGHHLYRTEQWYFGFYLGYHAKPMFWICKNSVRFDKYDYAKTRFTQKVVSGAFACLCSTILNNPIDIVKTKMKFEIAAKYTGFVDCFKQI